MKLYNIHWQSIWTGTPPEDLERLQRYCELASDSCHHFIAIEVGTHEGATAALLAEWFETIICIDPWGEHKVESGELIATFFGNAATMPEFTTFIGNMERLNLFHRVIPIVNTVRALDRLPKLDVALAFVDDGHTYHDCSRDIKAVLTHLAPAGILVCHDYYGDAGPCGSYIGVKQAVEEAIKIYDLEVIEHSGGIIALRRRI